ncbi:hypothetical protein, partial [Rhodanobacter denitrificans]|uniref:hypothetical protein n=2 Tax=Rhodanobacteraceae TaxID=1775411 RepID=UPI0005BA10A3
IPALGLMNSRVKDIALLLAGLLPTAVVVFLAFVLVPGCIAIYGPVSGQLPPQTKFVFSFYYLSLVLPVLVAGVWLFWRGRWQRGVVAALLGSVGSVAVGAFGWWAVYQPQLILQLIGQSGS